MRSTFLPLLLLAAAAHAAELRDPWLWPFAARSIWNMPIGAEADYRSEGALEAQGAIGSDTEFHYRLRAGVPERPLFSGVGGRKLRDWPIADDIVVRDQISNNVAAFLSPDGKTLAQLQPFLRPERGGPLYGAPNPFWGGVDLRGDGIIGTHWGSGLSGFGGTLRHGELTGAAPIRHALKLDVWCKKDGAITVRGFARGAATTVFDRVQDPAPAELRAGRIGFGGEFTVCVFDNVRLEGASVRAVPSPRLLDGVGDSGAWQLDHAAITDSRLEVSNWQGDARALFTREQFATPLVIAARVQSAGGTDGNKARVFFHHRDDHNTYVLEWTGGGEKARVELRKIVNGEETKLAAATGWHWPALEIRCDAEAINVTGLDGEKRTPVFDRIRDTTLRSGALGFGASFNQLTVTELAVTAAP